MGHVITFYSYKGGVGRSMALANISVALAQFGHNVLIVDWDLEAPGIEEYFRPYLKIQEVIRQRGIVDLLWNEFQQESRPKDREDWQSLIIKVKVPNAKGNLHILTAGRKDEEYFGKVQSLDFQRFYEQKNGGVFIEMLRDEWKTQYDFILVDSRTGITDIGGICTIQLPDTLVLMFTATEEALSGAINVAHKVQVAHQSLPYDRLSITCIPIPARFDTQTEFRISQEWLDRFSSDLSGMYANWLPKSVEPRKILEITKVPYLSYFSYGEKLPIVEQGTSDPTGLGFSYETLAALLANNLEFVERLIQDRESFVRLAQKKKIQRQSIFISYSHKDEEWKDRLLQHLGILQQEAFADIWDDRRVEAGDDWYLGIESAINQASVAILTISANFLTSKFILGEEVPNYLNAAQKKACKLSRLLLNLVHGHK